MKSLALIVLLAAGVSVHAASFNLSTGQAPLVAGQVDSLWTINGNNALVTNANGAWTGGTMFGGSQWINLAGDPNHIEPATPFLYSTTFDLTGLDHSSASFNVTWSSDNGSTLKLNGVTLANLPGGSNPNRSYQTYSTYTITTGFVAGLNTLEFDVVNGDDELSSTPGPIGLKATINGTAEAVPEPASMAVLAVGAAALLRRRRK